MKVIAVATQKGGTGKTTTAGALAQAAAATGKKVLAIDLDAQGDFTSILKADEHVKGSFDLLNGERITKTIQETEQGIDAIAASIALNTLKTTKGSANILQQELMTVKKLYDLVVIDTPPHINVLLYNALQACNALVIPMQTNIFSLQGLYTTVETAAAFQKTNKELTTIGGIITCYEGRSIIDRNMEDAIKKSLNDNNILYFGKIRKAVAIKEAQTVQESLYSYAPKSKPAIDYMKLLDTILKEI